MRKILPLKSPPISAHLFHMFPLSILATCTDYLPWFYSNYIQLYRFAGGGLKFYVHPFSPGSSLSRVYYTTCPWLDIQVLDQTLIARTLGEFSLFIRHCIDADYYVQVDADFYFLPDRQHFQQRHFLHELLISGYDLEEETVHVSGFDARGVYAHSWVAHATVEQSISTPKQTFFEEYEKQGTSVPDWLRDSMLERPRLFLYRYIPQGEYEFDVEAVAEQLQDYLHSADTAQRFRMLANPRPDGLWGMATYEYLSDLLSRLPSGEQNGSAIPLRTFWEHKKCMLDRLRYMESGGYLGPANEFSRAFEELVKKAQQLRLILLRWQNRQAPSSIDISLDLLRQIATTECSLLGSVLAQIHGL